MKRNKYKLKGLILPFLILLSVVVLVLKRRCSRQNHDRGNTKSNRNG